MSVVEQATAKVLEDYPDAAYVACKQGAEDVAVKFHATEYGRRIEVTLFGWRMSSGAWEFDKWATQSVDAPPSKLWDALVAAV